MTAVNLVAARRGLFVKLVSVFRDWMAAGLITPIGIIDVDSLDDSLIPTLLIDGGGARMRLLEQALSGQLATVARLCVVSDVSTPTSQVAPSASQQIVGALRSSLSQIDVLQLRLFVGASGADWRSGLAPQLGWHNLVLAPEDSMAPGYPSLPLTNSADDPRWLMAVAGSLASLLGLWVGQISSELDGRTAPGGGLVAPVRCFSRALSADEVEEAVAHALMDVGVHYPTPRVDNQKAVSAPDPVAAALGMADELLAKHPSVLPRARTTPAPPAPRAIGFVEALKAFFTFMIDAIKGAPRAIANAAVHRAKASLAQAVTHVVYGAESGFAVVVRGVRADGSPATWTEFEAGVDAVTLRAGQPAGELGAPFQDPALWEDYVRAGMTLLDAGNRDAQLPYRTVGTSRAVIVETAHVAPRQDEPFELPAHLAAYLPNWRVEAVDSIGLRRLYERLDGMRNQYPNLAGDIAHEQQRLRTWVKRGQQSYAGHVGTRLAGAYHGLVEEISQIESKVAALQQQSGDEETVGGAYDRAGRTVRLLTTGLVLLLAILGVLAGLTVITVPVLISVSVLGLIGWVVSGSLVLLSAQRELFRYLHRKAQAESELKVAQEHRLDALEDLRRVSRAYRQYLDWTRVFSAFIHAPLGKSQSATAGAMPVGSGMPLSTRMGRAIPTTDAVDEVSDRWRSHLFEVQWLSRAWEEFVVDVPNSLGELRFSIQNDPSLLRSDPDLDGQGPTLTRWSHAVAHHAPHRRASSRFLRELKALTQSDQQARDQLLKRVVAVDPDSGTPREYSRPEFLAGLESLGEPTGQTFLDGAFASSASPTARLVSHRLRSQQSDGLTTATVVVELGQGMTTTEYRGVGKHQDGPIHDAPPDDGSPDEPVCGWS